MSKAKVYRLWFKVLDPEYNNDKEHNDVVFYSKTLEEARDTLAAKLRKEHGIKMIKWIGYVEE